MVLGARAESVAEPSGRYLGRLAVRIVAAPRRIPERLLYYSCIKVTGIYKGTEFPMTQTIAIERVDHIGIRVRDLDRALAFYRVLGFATNTAWSLISFSTPMPAIRTVTS